MPSRFDRSYRIGGDTEFTADLWNRILREIDARIVGIEEKKVDFEVAEQQMVGIALARINEALLPAYDRILGLTQLGALFTQTSPTAVTVGLGEKVFMIPDEGAARALFAPTNHLAVTLTADPEIAMYGHLGSYDRESGVLVVNVSEAIGEGDHSGWKITASPPRNMLHELDEDDPHGARAQAIAVLRGAVAGELDTLEKLATAVSGRLAKSANLEDLQDKPTARSILGVGYADDGERGAFRANIEAGILAGHRNKIINGDFGIWQRNTGTVTVGVDNGYWGPDRFVVRGTGSTGGGINIARHDAGPAWFGRPRMNFTRVGCTDDQYVLQRIEGLEQFSGKTVTLTMLINADTAEDVLLYVNGNYGTGGNPSAGEDFYDPNPITVPGGGGVHKITKVIQIPDLTDKVFGSNGNSYLSVGPIFTGTDDKAIRMSSISLVVGDAEAEADPFSPRHPQQELALCQRYYEKTYGASIAPGSASFDGFVRSSAVASGTGGNARNSAGLIWSFKVSKRTGAPTGVVFSPGTGASGKCNTSGGDVDAEVVSASSHSAFVRPSAGESIIDTDPYNYQIVVDAEL